MDEHKQKVMNEIWSIYTRIDDLDSFMGQSGILKAVKAHHGFLASHKTEEKLEQIILKDCKQKLVEASQGVDAKMRGYKDPKISQLG